MAFRDLETATRQAASHPDVLRRLTDLKIYMRYFHLMWMFDRASGRADREKLALEVLRHTYKTRKLYMFDWAWLGKWWIGKLTNWHPKGTVGDPQKWDYWNPDAPWRDDTAYTPAEIEAFFQEGLSHFQPQKIIERTFSDDLVPVKFVNYDKNRRSIDRAQYQGDGTVTTTYAMYSTSGNDLKLSMITAFYYNDKPPLYYRLEDPQGNLISDGTFPLDKAEHHLAVSVPRAGLYFLCVQDNGAGWTIRAHVDTPLALKIQGDGSYHNHQGDKDWYFYVPAGTKEICYFPGNDSYTHELRDATGTLVATVPHDGQIKTIPVPPGQDGKLWRLHGQVRAFWFHNLPNWLGGAPNALMIPREVAKRDGIKLR